MRPPGTSCSPAPSQTRARIRSRAIEADETWYGGRPRAAETRAGKGRLRLTHQPTVLGMVERGGRVRTRVVPDRGGPTLKGDAPRARPASSMIVTDEWRLYVGLEQEYRGHRRIKPSAKGYVDGDTHTQTVEGFFGLFKTGVRGVYHAVSCDTCRATWTNTASATTGGKAASLFSGRCSTGLGRLPHAPSQLEQVALKITRAVRRTLLLGDVAAGWTRARRLLVLHEALTTS